MEERKDSERARGALDELQKKDKQNLGELQKSLCDSESRREDNLAMAENARDKGKLQNELDTSRIVMEKLK